ncbi:S1/P1 nuclease [Gayadomonas joobiniege]|uniref:S1/P1 nuclease n=1 Tax=Gayadomonas joobiniege TaxID=1234606 RepID=UPI000366DAD1|nr:S1/P1 nuclease [Gayadomonas joobiniege]
MTNCCFQPKLSLVLTVSICLLSTELQAYGKLGHQLVAELAEEYLTTASKQQIKHLLGRESLAQAATYLDRMRDHPSPFWQKKAARWHYVTANHHYLPSQAPKWGDAYTAYQNYYQQLANRKLSTKTRRLALYFVVHLVADMHQPLHVGNGQDKGGNTIALWFQGKRTNLHRIWDSQLLYAKKVRRSQWLNDLKIIIKKNNLQKWQQTDPLVWLQESIQLRKTIYPTTRTIEHPYIKKHLPAAERRLAQAGVRLAAVLNLIFK